MKKEYSKKPKRNAGKPVRVFDLYWSPTGQKIATVEASTAKIAKSKAPAPYRKYKGEIYVEDRGVRDNPRRSRTNPSPTMKRTAPKGWVKASAVKIRRRGGRVEVLVRK